MNELSPPPARTGAEAFLARFRRLRGQLPGDPAIRDAAAAAFAAMGLPTRRDEAWRYTTLQPIADTAFREPLTEVSAAPILGPVPGGPRVVLVDGPLPSPTCPRPPQASP